MYQWECCEEKYKRKYFYNKHKKSCFPDAPLCQAAKSFVCDNCGKIFARKQNLQNHETVRFKSIDSSLVKSTNFNARVENIAQEIYVFQSYDPSFDVFSCSVLGGHPNDNSSIKKYHNYTRTCGCTHVR